MSALFLIMAMLADPLRDPCRDDDMVDRCSPAKQAEVRALYRVPPIESYAGATVRRVFFVDGYGNDTVAIEFLRQPEKDPLVRVHFPRSNGEAPVAPIVQVLGSDQWHQVLAASENFDRQFAAAAGPGQKGENEKGDEDIVLCLHSWVYWAEAIDRSAKARSTVNDACNDAPVEQFAWAAARIAISAFPYCNAIDPKLSRNDVTRLRSCARLAGDRLAAATVFNDANGFRLLDSPKHGGLDGIAAHDVELDFQGSRTTGEDARAFWRSLMSRENAPDFYYQGIHGLNARHAIVRGELVQAVSDNEYQRANVEMRWESDGETFDLKSMSVGPYRPLVMPSE